MPYLSSSARICVADRPLSVNSSMLPISHVAQLPEHVLALRLRRGVLAEADDVGERELLDRDLIDGHPSPGAVRLGRGRGWAVAPRGRLTGQGLTQTLLDKQAEA